MSSLQSLPTEQSTDLDSKASRPQSQRRMRRQPSFPDLGFVDSHQPRYTTPSGPRPSSPSDKSHQLERPRGGFPTEDYLAGAYSHVSADVFESSSFPPPVRFFRKRGRSSQQPSGDRQASTAAATFARAQRNISLGRALQEFHPDRKVQPWV
jgi:hypothetical protein